MFPLILAFVFLSQGCAIRSSCEYPPSLPHSVERLRGLKFKQQVPCQERNAAALEEILNESVAVNNEPERIEREEALFRMVGFLGFKDSYAEFLEKYFRGSIGGFYSPRLKQLMTNTSLRGERGEEIIAHELTHALQDQHFGLSKYTTEQVTTDCSLARLALVEGDANRVMKLVKGKEPCNKSRIRGIDISLHANEFEGVKPAQMALLRLFSFPYRYGAQFVCELYETGGSNAINEAVLAPPSSTLEILGLADTNNTPRECKLRELPSSPDSLGVFGVFALLTEWIELPEAKRAAEGLISDELVWSKDQLTWTLQWQSAAESQEFFSLFNQSQQIRLGLPIVSSNQDESSVLASEFVSLSMSMHDNLVVIQYSPIKDVG